MDYKQNSNEGRKPNMMFEAIRFVKACFKNWIAFVVCLVVVMTLAAVYILVSNPKNEVTAQLMLPPESSPGGMLALSDMMGNFSMGDMFGGSSTDNEVAMIQSHSVFEKTARDLKLNIAYFQSKYFMDWLQVYDQQVRIRMDVDPAIADTITMPLVFKLRENGSGKFSISVKRKNKTIYKASDVDLPATVPTAYGSFTFTKTPAFDDPALHISRFNFTFTSYNAAAQSYVKMVPVFAPSKKTDFICMSFACHNTDFGKKLLNTIIDNYNLICNSQKNDKNAINLNFVDKRIASLENELAVAETSMQKFKEANKIMEPELDAGALLQKDMEMEASLLNVQTENEVLKMTRDFLLDSKNDGEFIPELGGILKLGTNDDGVSAIDKYNELVLNVKSRDIRMNDTEGDYAQEFNLMHIKMLKNNILASINRAIAASDTRLAELKRSAGETTSRISAMPAAEREYIGLERDLIVKQQLYLFLLKQKEESEMSLAKVVPSLLTIDAPYTVTEPSGLTPKLVIALAFFLSIFLGMAYVFLLKLKNQPFGSATGLQDALDSPVFASVDVSTSDMPVLDPGNQGESIRNLRAVLMPVLAKAGGNALLVTSAKQGEGKTYVASNLAASLALAGYSTVLVNGDLRGDEEPIKTTRPGASLCSLIEGAHTPADIETCSVGASRLYFVPAGVDASHNPADVLSSPSLASVMDSLKKAFDFVVVDSTDITEYSDTYSFAPCVDVTALVARVGVTTPVQTAADNDIFKAGRLPRIGMVVNM